jgi:hypothetical protein
MAEAYDAYRSMCDWTQPDIIKEIIASTPGWGGGEDGEGRART